MEKQCFKCGATKPLDHFYAHPQMKDGRLNKCKGCARQDSRINRSEKIDRVREYDRQRSKLPHRVAKRKEIFEREWEVHPDRMKARNAVSNAVRDGRLHKKPCAFCGSADQLEAHHHDYSKPLDVTWLCKPCHRRFHALERMATYRDEAA